MPQATDLVLKDHSGTDRTFTLLTPAAGYGTPAEWAYKVGPVRIGFPNIQLVAQRQPGNVSSNAKLKFRFPVVVDSPSTGLPQKVATWEANLSVTEPDAFPESSRDDAVAFLSNAIASSLVKMCLRDGLPAN